MAATEKAKHTAEQSALQTQAVIDAVRDNPYVQRLFADEDLRDQIQDAINSSRAAYKRANKAKNPARALMSDKKLQSELKSAFESAKTAQTALRDAPAARKVTRSRSGGRLKLIGVVVIGAIVAVAASSGLRDKVLDLLFGPEETFDYVPTANGNGTAQPAATPQNAAS